MTINFDGSIKQAVTSDSILNPPTAAGTVTLWFKPRIGSIGSLRFMAGTDTGWHVRIQGNGKLGNRLRNSVSVDSVSVVVEDVWQHGAFTYTSAPNVREVFYNGAFEASDSRGGGTIINNNFSIGRLITSNTDFFDGNIFDVRIYDRVLSEGEIQSIYNARGADRVFSGLIHRWPLDELSGVDVPSTTGVVRDRINNLDLTRFDVPRYEEGPFSILEGVIL